jgi:hypothetical protein
LVDKVLEFWYNVYILSKQGKKDTMAYMSQQSKALLAPAIKAVLRKYKMKGSIAVRNHSTLAVTIKSGPLDIIGNYNETVVGYERPKAAVAKDSIQVNHYHINSHYSGRVAAFLTELNDAMNVGNHDRSDIQSDYFDVGWYVDINVGKWNQPYVYTGKAAVETVKPECELSEAGAARKAKAVAYECAALATKLRTMKLTASEQAVLNHAADILERYA